MSMIFYALSYAVTCKHWRTSSSTCSNTPFLLVPALLARVSLLYEATDLYEETEVVGKEDLRCLKCQENNTSKENGVLYFTILQLFLTIHIFKSKMI